jgi:hypothetical protein
MDKDNVKVGDHVHHYKNGFNNAAFGFVTKVVGRTINVLYNDGSIGSGLGRGNFVLVEPKREATAAEAPPSPPAKVQAPVPTPSTVQATATAVTTGTDVYKKWVSGRGFLAPGKGPAPYAADVSRPGSDVLPIETCCFNLPRSSRTQVASLLSPR